ncbi:phosphate ABC transporter substrate-binding/OmpA family protein [Atopomonas sediminilitoris]|uniref:phosphate ABC transporter substrate-binding/OmpA family protein n=1 Tax=Atopomonas sediminilitoris TaxID=2919919 RepID=UPI001F4F0815|nr:substrate-binding domain-containing protein [Atopomonas sediminilitoris]MCJ8167811.1 substrate-binding domain-containing protein [Atopomonas sediminilitoris]
MTRDDLPSFSNAVCALLFFLLATALYLWPVSSFASNSLPIIDPNQPVLRIQGSNTIGSELSPALVEALFKQQGFNQVTRRPGSVANEQRIEGRNAVGQSIFAELAAHGSSTGFVGLSEGTTDIAAASRPIKDSEAQALLNLGDLKSQAAEHIIAIDGLAIIVHPSNPLQQTDTATLARLFAGEISDWSEVGGSAGPVKVYARDEQSGTFDTFNELVLKANGKALSPEAKRYESSDQLSDDVSRDRHAIGFIGLPYIRQAKALAVADGESQAMQPLPTLLATEDYPLSRRLFLYHSPSNTNPWVHALMTLANSQSGQAVVTQYGFIGQHIQSMHVATNKRMPAAYQELSQQAQRLSVNFRFAEGSSKLDNKAMRDIQRVFDYLYQADKLERDVVLVGFGDPKKLDRPGRAELLSKLRTMAVRRELIKQGVMFRDYLGLGAALPVAANDGDEGRNKNRRVEVWVY